jgi:lysophospholipase L1-like esterase
VAFRLLAILLGLMPFVLLEILFAALGWGRPKYYEDDPLVDFRAVRPLFVRNPETDLYEIPPTRQDYFRPQSFPAHKAPDEFRIFCLGGSTVQGRPYSTETSLTTWLQLSLQAAGPARSWRVVNCGGVSYATYRLMPILEEVLGYDPDLIIVYTGQNEFLEDRTYRDLRDRSQALARIERWASRLRIYCLAREACLRFGGPLSEQGAPDRSVLGEEVEAILDYRGGLEHYHRDEHWHRDVVAHFSVNVSRMVSLTRRAGVPLVLVNPVSNLRDCPPFKSEHRAGLSSGPQQKWETLVQSARRRYGTDLRQAVELFEQAAAIDDRHAGLQYQLGQCYDALGDMERAKRHYLLAKDLDVCPLRMLEVMHERLRDIAVQSGTPLVDARALIAEQCRGGIPDESWMADHVHPSIRGHQRIADALADGLVSQGVVQPSADWHARRDLAYQTHLDSLDTMYFEEGKRRLAGLQRWARGRSTLVPQPKRAK